MTRTRSDSTRKRTAPSDQAEASAMDAVWAAFTGQKQSEEERNPHAARETVESIVVAIILAFLFRGFVAEAFVIPTGSMAHVLRGRHIDMWCPKCQFHYHTGASSENPDTPGVPVSHTTCPVCRYSHELDKVNDPNERSFNGDRILVSKFAYSLGEPERWDVIVFKYPGNAKQNYIKRLIGLPGETVVITRGDIYVLDAAEQQKPVSEQRLRIARKPPSKLKAMLQVVDDTQNVAEVLRESGWPERWAQIDHGNGANWMLSDDGVGYLIDAADADAWLRYRHLVPTPDDWDAIETNRLSLDVDNLQGQLITDYYGYNDAGFGYRGSNPGTCWVGDLALAGEVEIQGDDGELLLKLVEGGVHYDCRIDIATGTAVLSIDRGEQGFADDAGQPTAFHPTGATSIRGRGTHHIRFSNCDNELLLWVDEEVVEFDSPTTYQADPNAKPQWTANEPHDAAPAGIGSHGVALHVKRLQVLRDVYYLASDWTRLNDLLRPDSDYYNAGLAESGFRRIFRDPTKWNNAELFDDRAEAVFELGPDQFFPLGDNSPHSKDARLWSENGTPPPYVERDLLIGKALLIYWPHGWRMPTKHVPHKFNFPLVPDFPRMRLIR